jgi:hypothetical protein
MSRPVVMYISYRNREIDNTDCLHLGNSSELPVLLKPYKKFFRDLPKKNYSVVYTINPKGKYFVHAPSHHIDWPVLTINGKDIPDDHKNHIYVCKLPKRFYNKRVDREVIG